MAKPVYFCNEELICSHINASICLSGYSEIGACVQVGKIGGLDAYFAEPKSTPKAGVMLIHDIHGWDKKNIRLVADKYADAGMPLVYHLYW